MVVLKRRSHLQVPRDHGVTGQIDCPETSVPSSGAKGPRGHGTDRLSRKFGPIFSYQGTMGSWDRLSRNVGPICRCQGAKGSWDQYVVPKRRSHLQLPRDHGVIGTTGCPETSVKITLLAAATSTGNLLPTFQYNLSVTSSGVKVPRDHGTGTASSLRNYHHSLRNNPEEGRSHLLFGGSLKSRTVNRFRRNLL